jgi:ribosome-associated protein
VTPHDPRSLVVNSRIQIPRQEFHFTFVRSSGPGGQNVNKVNTKAVLRWAIGSSQDLPEDVRQRFLKRFRNRVTSTGDVVISSQQFRNQARNVADCLARLREMLASVAVPPVRRRRTKPSRGSVERRLKNKHAQSKKKSRRSSSGWTE